MYLIKVKVTNLPHSFLKNTTPRLNDFHVFKKQIIEHSKSVASQFSTKKGADEKIICELQIYNCLIFLITLCTNKNILSSDQFKKEIIEQKDVTNMFRLPYQLAKSVAFISQMFYPGCYPEYNQWKKIYNILESLTVEKKYTGYNEYVLNEKITKPTYIIQTVDFVTHILMFILPKKEYYIEHVWNHKHEHRDLFDDFNLWIDMMSNLVQVERIYNDTYML
tara:strand:- start:1806 stop:2468 length:663 start_codon:yes stop_codon:yes gene_type:complete